METDKDSIQESDRVPEQDLKNRLAAAEFDAKLIGIRAQSGSHPNLMEV
ncbi:MAG TPA: hypothetical protein VGQ03_05030 [Nitrososphaera sp.]|nr:hypothetical protein [Nitrososphaera sp.]